ncbi:MAG TPA: hypothetical protein VFZ12_05875, partial [Dehalococcoidia bacterium]|nr:hypothetical protein [Dehalococcoidia bacterium]
MRLDYSFEGLIEAGSQPAGSYFYLPFAVPDGASRLTASYHYENGSRAEETPEPAPSEGRPEQNVIDIAIFDARGIDPISGGFRGYSGSARQSFFIDPHSATPGYLPGELGAGEWNLMLGVAELLPEGARWWASIELDVETEALRPPGSVSFKSAPKKQPLTGGGRWIPGDLHSHTEHSDGSNTVDELATYSYECGHQYLAVTDHNTTSH